MIHSTRCNGSATVENGLPHTCSIEHGMIYPMQQRVQFHPVRVLALLVFCIHNIVERISYVNNTEAITRYYYNKLNNKINIMTNKKNLKKLTYENLRCNDFDW